jgi:hypothetical protein
MAVEPVLKRVRRLLGLGALLALVGGCAVLGWAAAEGTWAARERVAVLSLPVAWVGILTAMAIGISRSVPRRKAVAGAVLTCSVAAILAAGAVLRAAG